VIVQPENRGTAAAILYGTMRIAGIAPLGAVAVPSDHYVFDDSRFMEHVAAAFAAVEERPDLVVLLGVTADSAETQYGWIESGEPIPGTGLLRVARFWEKPAAVSALLAMLRDALPSLSRAFEAVQPLLGTSTEPPAIRALYENLAPLSFSDDVLAKCPANLAVMPVNGVQWSDLGQPKRVIETLSRLRMEPAWVERVAEQSA
jgi:mannose-1-phosphate guanylyltransferase